ncbi:serine/threonine-protein phosphatase 6 regulatory ankyrin repeat subunit B [Cinnamomum micranthum f. kanehirae]|uniref:Serine/threonine-protein phosphatase 6 regulatory ankyrin repeat subunit B n=1 Tax=Cinnamomum micranthum f. kanehirae TaxID=337451 RepID=A0A3S3NSR0_9MAGN|nr:serine/threonine-protein phosphatase 6 regulatory ankyrin repeat subunit B [Cinnamomum micranthum f. kanehirae]
MDRRLLDALTIGSIEKLQILYREDSSILQQKTTQEDTPLHLASRSISNRKELVSTILHWQPIMAMETNSNKDTPLHDACRVGDLEIVNRLLDAHPCVAYMLNTAKESAFFIACSCGHKEVASALCNRMDFRAWDEIGASCLRIAASKGFTEIVEKILKDNPSSASRKDDDGFSALHFASREGKDEVIKTLIDKDSKLSFLKDNEERTPLHWAVIKNQRSVLEAFLSPSSLNSVQVADLINRADKDGNTVLHLAAINDNLEVIELLLTKRPIKVNDANNEGLTALDILEKDQPSEAGEDASSGQRARIINQLKAGKRPDPISQTTMQETSLNNMRQALIVVAGLIVTLTFQAGLNPPGGLWQDSKQGNETNHKPGKAIQSETNLWLFSVFLASNALGFILSLALIPLIMTLQTNTLRYVNSLVVMALVSVEVAFIFGLIMISDRKPLYHVEIFVLIFVTLAGIIGWAKWKLIRS